MPNGSAVTHRCTCPGCSTGRARRGWTRSSASSRRRCSPPSARNAGQGTSASTSGTPPASRRRREVMSVQNRTGLTSQASPPVQRRIGLALLVIATAELMLVLDDTIVNVALPSMQRSLHLATSHLNWVISFYALAFGGLLLAGGRAGDLFGRLRVFRVGVGVFTLASVAGGFAPNGPVLIAARG